ncbi:hypothetical protein CUW27_20820 [Salmonella enterica]|nr:hypothetical protein [Salmonella enterica]
MTAYNEYMNRRMPKIQKYGFAISDQLQAALFVCPNLDFSALAQPLRTEAQYLDYCYSRVSWAILFVDECAAKGWKDETGVYYPVRGTRYRLTDEKVERVLHQSITEPYLKMHPGATWNAVTVYISRLDSGVLNGLIATAIASDDAPEPELVLPWQHSDHRAPIVSEYRQPARAGLLK